MKKIALIALKSVPYGGKRRKPGAIFNATGHSDARVLIAIGAADFAPAVQNPEPPSAAPAVDVEFPIAVPTADLSPAQVAAIVDLSRDLLAEPETLPPAEQPAEQPPQAPAESAPAEPVKPRRTYRRRDLTAEGSEG